MLRGSVAFTAFIMCLHAWALQGIAPDNEQHQIAAVIGADGSLGASFDQLMRRDLVLSALPALSFVDSSTVLRSSVRQTAPTQTDVSTALQGASTTKDAVQAALQAASTTNGEVEAALAAVSEQRDQVYGALRVAADQKTDVQAALQAIGIVPSTAAEAVVAPSIDGAAVTGIAINAVAPPIAAVHEEGVAAVASKAVAAFAFAPPVDAAAVTGIAINAVAPPMTTVNDAVVAAVAPKAVVAFASPSDAPVVTGLSATPGWGNFGLSVVKTLCMLVNVLVFLSPYAQVRGWETRRSTGEADAAPHASIAFLGWQWCFYGLFAYSVTNESGFLILVYANCLGAILGTYYVVTFLRYCTKHEAMDSMKRYLSAILSLVTLQACAIGAVPLQKSLFLTGMISSFCATIGAISVLSTLPGVLRTKNSESILAPFAVAMLCGGCLWFLCGWMLKDPLVMLPNAVTVVCCSISLVLKHAYPSKKHRSSTAAKQASAGEDTPSTASGCDDSVGVGDDSSSSGDTGSH